MTPEEIDSDVTNIVQLLGIKKAPIYIDVTPEPYSKAIECFPNVDVKISRDGGAHCYGWQIWKTEILIEAEFHAIWKSPSGDLRDITPKQIPISRILFLPDSEAIYSGCQIDNVRINITNNRLVDDFIELSNAIFRFENKDERAFNYELKLSPKDAHIHAR